MNDWKLYGKCFKCKKNKLFVSKRQIKLPIGQIATSRELFCYTCNKDIKTTLAR